MSKGSLSSLTERGGNFCLAKYGDRILIRYTNSLRMYVCYKMYVFFATVSKV